MVRMLYPASANDSVLLAMDRFLRRLGVELLAETDPDVPVLMKNVSIAGR
jgi:hypothetical protein